MHQTGQMVTPLIILDLYVHWVSLGFSDLCDFQKGPVPFVFLALSTTKKASFRDLVSWIFLTTVRFCEIVKNFQRLL